MNKVNKKPRKSLTKKQLTFLEIFKKKACLVSTACSEANISRGAYYKWLNGNGLFEDGVNAAKEEFLDFGEAQIITLMKETKDGIHVHPSAIIHFAKTKLKDRGYGDKQTIEHSGSLSNVSISITKAEKEE